MKEYPTLKNSPLTEAIIDIQVKLKPEFDVNNINKIFELIKNDYPIKEEQILSESVLKIEKDTEVSNQVKTKINGYRYSSSDKKQIIQARLNGFSFSRLHPYINWNQTKEEADKLWKHYNEITLPISITRVGLRYINNLNIPMPIDDFSDYLAAPPTIPNGISQTVSGFITRVVVYEPKIDANIVITQVLDRIINPEIAPVILDIDIFHYKQDGIEEKYAWELIEKFRFYKNKVFFSSITDKLKEIYK